MVTWVEHRHLRDALGTRGRATLPAGVPGPRGGEVHGHSRASCGLSRIWPLELGQPFVGKAGIEASVAGDTGQEASRDEGIPLSLSPGGTRAACGKAAQLAG